MYCIHFYENKGNDDIHTALQVIKWYGSDRSARQFPWTMANCGNLSFLADR